MFAGKASCDYPHTDIRKGDDMPTHPALQSLLPLVIALYGEKTSLVCHHPSREIEVAFVPFTTGVPCYVHSFLDTRLATLQLEFQNCSHTLIHMTFCSLFVTVAIKRSCTSLGILYSFTKPTQGDDQAVCPHHKGASPLLAH